MPSNSASSFESELWRARLWLRNRQPDRWRDKHEVDVSGAGESLLDDMAEDQLIERVMQRRGLTQRQSS
jgi:hypothetical protein